MSLLLLIAVVSSHRRHYLIINRSSPLSLSQVFSSLMYSSSSSLSVPSSSPLSSSSSQLSSPLSPLSPSSSSPLSSLLSLSLSSLPKFILISFTRILILGQDFTFLARTLSAHLSSSTTGERHCNLRPQTARNTRKQLISIYQRILGDLTGVNLPRFLFESVRPLSIRGHSYERATEFGDQER